LATNNQKRWRVNEKAAGSLAGRSPAGSPRPRRAPRPIKSPLARAARKPAADPQVDSVYPTGPARRIHALRGERAPRRQIVFVGGKHRRRAMGHVNSCYGRRLWRTFCWPSQSPRQQQLADNIGDFGGTPEVVICQSFANRILRRQHDHA
jgi:hypothetical protein